MKIHQSNPNRLPDTEFISGALSYLIEGNVCRALDNRRTPGFIEKVFHDHAMFRWRITDFEDKGKYWDLPVENALKYQFAKDSQQMDEQKLRHLKRTMDALNVDLLIEPDASAKTMTQKEITSVEKEVYHWLKNHSTFVKNEESLGLNAPSGCPSLARDLIAYLASRDLASLEERTAENMVLNPRSGEWIKGMEIVLAEMGLVRYRDKQPRTPEIFSAHGSKTNRQRYLIHRMAFVRAFFRLYKIEEVVLYRGMSTEGAMQSIERRFISCTFSLEVARTFADFEADKRFQNIYLARMVVPIERLLMTYLETQQMNRQYQEAEALILSNSSVPPLW